MTIKSTSISNLFFASIGLTMALISLAIIVDFLKSTATQTQMMLEGHDFKTIAVIKSKYPTTSFLWQKVARYEISFSDFGEIDDIVESGKTTLNVGDRICISGRYNNEHKQIVSKLSLIDCKNN
jgi:hypothetical protein